MTVESKWQGSPHGYGLLNNTDIVFFEKKIKTIASKFSNSIKFLEIGVCNAYTARGLANFCSKNSIRLEYHGVDMENGIPHPGVMPSCGTFHLGDSSQIFESIPDGFNMLFIDGCHCSNHVMLDFLNYSPKVVVGGYVIFHDTNPSPEWQGIHENTYQGHGPKTPAFHIATHQALIKLGLLQGYRLDWTLVGCEHTGTKLGMTCVERNR